MERVKMQKVTNLRKGPANFRCLVSCGELLKLNETIVKREIPTRELEQKKGSSGIERGLGLGRGKRCRTLLVEAAVIKRSRLWRR